MNARTDPQLLLAYAQGRSEAAFTELVRRHIDLVHSAAFRVVNDPHLAKDVSQGVFVALAKNVNELTNHPVLSGWLHRTTRNIAAQTVRTEVRRRRREEEVATMNEYPETDISWEQISPHLDAALAELSASDRDAVILRYFENKPAQEMAAILCISAEAAQKRVSRAVERLRGNFAKRGITAGAAGLSGIISANAVQAAPAGLAAAISPTALAGVIPSAAATTGILTMTALKKSLAVAVIAIFAGTAVYQAARRSRAAVPLPRKPEEASVSREREPRAKNSVVKQFAKAREQKPRIDRRAELERLKARWMESDAGNGIITKEHEKLANETAAALLCGGEALELVSFLNANRRGIAASVVKDGISKYLASKEDPEARELLIEEAGDNVKELLAQRGDPLAWKSVASERYQLLAEWSKAIGRSCSAKDLEEFCAGLKSEDFAQEALFGYNAALMRTDSEAAVRGTLEALAAKIDSYTSGESLKLLFWEELPADVDFARLEQILPPGEGRENESPVKWGPIEWGRHELFGKWAKTDPAGAANYVIAHPDRLVARFVGEIVGSQYYKDPNGLIDWVSEFPEGPYFDHAAASAAIYARGQPGIFELIGKIQDPKLRAEAEKNAKVPLTNSNTR